MFCHRCGAQVDDQAAFCDKCGAALQNTLRPANAVTSVSPEVNVSPTAYAPATGVSGVFPAPVQYAGFWRRFGAALIDGLLLGVVYLALAFAVGFIYGWAVGVEPGDATMDTLVSAVSVVTVMLGWLYYAAMESSARQGTLGKMALGITVTDAQGRRVSFGRATARYFGRIVSAIILYIGFLIIAFTEKKQGLHDIMADCLVVVKKPPYPTM